MSLTLLLLSLTPSALAAPPQVEAALGQKRVLIVLGEAQSPEFKKEARILKEGAAELKKRDVAVFREGKLDGPLHQNYGQGKGFLLMLIGKDKTEKMRAVQPVVLQTITGMVDAMPMRQQEVKDSEKKK